MVGGGRSWVQRALIVVSAVLAAGGTLAASAVGYGVYRIENIPTEDLGDVLEPVLLPPTTTAPVAPDGEAARDAADAEADQQADEQAAAEAAEEEAAEEEAAAEDVVGVPFNVLLVGDSSRDFVDNQDDLESFGGAGEGRGSDSILLVRVDPAAGTAATLPFPRDLWVELADGSGRQRINKAYERGGARLLIETIRERFGVPINHYVRLDFAGFRGLVDAVGGVTLAIEHPVRDHNRATGRNESGLLILEPGCVTLGGDQALAFVRSRHFQERIDGRWVADRRNDFGRSERQQQFVRQVLQKALSEGLLDPRRVLDLLDVADQSLRLSDELDAEAITALARDARRLSTDAFTHYALPVTDFVTAGGAQVLLLDRAAAEPVFDVFRGLAPPAVLGPPPPAPPAPDAPPPAPGVTTTTIAPAPLC